MEINSEVFKANITKFFINLLTDEMEQRQTS